MPAITSFLYALAGVAFLTSMLTYSRIPEPYCGPGCAMALARPLIAFALPAALALVVGLLGLLWKRDPIRDRDAHMESAYNAVIATVALLILGLHLTVLFTLTSQLQIHLVRFAARGVPIMLGLALMIIGNLLPRFRPNIVIGIRTSRSLADRGVWARANRTAGYAAVGSGAAFVLAGLLTDFHAMVFATLAAAWVMATFVWSAWRSRHA